MWPFKRSKTSVERADTFSEDDYATAAHKIFLNLQTAEEVMMWALPQSAIDKCWKLSADATDPSWKAAFARIARFYQRRRDGVDQRERESEERRARAAALLAERPPTLAPPQAKGD